MANRYALQQVGVIDGTVAPPTKYDGSQVGAKVRRILCSKAVLADAIADTVTLCKVPAGARVTSIRINTDTSLSTSTIAIGIAGTVEKYVVARTFTTPLDAWTSIGPKASVVNAAALTADETLIMTVAALALPVAAIMHIEVEYTISA